MNTLGYLIDFYNNNEEYSVDEILTDVLKNAPGYSELSKEEILNLRRNFFDYVKEEEERLIYPERAEIPCDEEICIFVESRSKTEFSTQELKRQRHPHKRYVEAFVNNISVPKTLRELYDHYLNGNDAQFLAKEAAVGGKTNWTSPRWAKRGDIVLFMHAKTANSALTRMRTELRSAFDPNAIIAKQLEKAIAEQLAFHKKYGGKIFAIGRVSGKPEKDNVLPYMHYKSRVFCDINALYLLNNPVDITEFNSFIKISSLSAITPLFGDPYERLKDIISQKNVVPHYFRNSFSTPFPHSLITKDNWMQLGLEYRNSFTLEIQFRQCYVDYLLRELGDQKTIYMECACYKGSNPTTFVDNVIRINKRYLPVEIKLNIMLERNLEGQCEQYCKLDSVVLKKKPVREAKIEEVIDNKVLVIDTYAVYMFCLKDRKIRFLYDLSDLKTVKDIKELREIVISKLW